MSNNIADLIINQPFKTYRSSSLLTPSSDKLNKEKQDKLCTDISKFLYDRYLPHVKVDSNASKYESWRDITSEIVIKNNTVIHEDNKLQFLIISHRSEVKLFPKQIFFFVKKGNNRLVLVLNKIQNQYQYVNDYIMEILEDLNDRPIIIKPWRLNLSVIPKLINKLSDYLVNFDMQLVYSPPIESDSLKDIIIDINRQDLKSINKGELYTNLCEFLYKQTKIRFNKILVHKFITAMIQISNDGRIRINYAMDDPDMRRVVWLLIDSINQSIVV